jgi:hypothetical protein
LAEQASDQKQSRKRFLSAHVIIQVSEGAESLSLSQPEFSRPLRERRVTSSSSLRPKETIFNLRWPAIGAVS